MMGDSPEIPYESALKICTEILGGRPPKLFSQCWGCLRFSKGDPARMCFNSSPDHRGCGLVNKRFDEGYQRPP
jgi:hypothetical protein